MIPLKGMGVPSCGAAAVATCSSTCRWTRPTGLDERQRELLAALAEARGEELGEAPQGEGLLSKLRSALELTGAPGPPAPAGGGPAPRSALVSAGAMVFVEDLARPVLTAPTSTTWSTCCGSGPGNWSWPPTGPGTGSPAGVAGAPRGPGPRPGRFLVGRRRRRPPPPARPAVTVAFVPTKGDRPEWVIQKLTELGVDRIVPPSRRSVVRWDGDRGERAAERLRRVAR